MKKVLFAIMMSMTSLCASAFGENFEPMVLEWEVGYFDPTTVGNPLPKSPVRPPQVALEDNVLTFEAFHPDYTLTLFDEDGEEVYQTIVLAGTNTVVLPSTLNGNYVLTLDFGGSYYFWSEIEL